MSGFEVEGYVLSGTLVLIFLVKAAKWIKEELISVVPIFRILIFRFLSKFLIEILVVRVSTNFNNRLCKDLDFNLLLERFLRESVTKSAVALALNGLLNASLDLFSSSCPVTAPFNQLPLHSSKL